MNTLTAGGFHKQYWLNTTATCSQAAAFPSCLIFAQGDADHRQEGLATVAVEVRQQYSVLAMILSKLWLPPSQTTQPFPSIGKYGREG